MKDTVIGSITNGSNGKIKERHFALGPYKPKQVLAEVEAYFGEDVIKLTAPGGRLRGSLRAYLKDRSIIVTCREDPERNDHETGILQQLSKYCDDVPVILGRTGPLIFQSDVGKNRLNRAIHATRDPAEKEELAGKAVQGLLNIQRAAEKTNLRDSLPHLGETRSWVKHFVTVASRFAHDMRLDDPGIDVSALGEAMMQPPARFVKWDARCGNAALDETGQMRWFDLEYSGMRHGAEDLAWLIADESWPLDGEMMTALIQDILTEEDTDNVEEYMEYLEQYSALHAIQRLRLIVQTARRRGWVGRIEAIKYDKVGADPRMAESLAERGAYFAGRHANTAPLVDLFESTAQAFRDVRAPKPEQGISAV